MSNFVMPDGSGAVRPSFSVVICTRDRAEQLDQCLESVMLLEYPRFEVLVVDNAPRDGLTREVALRRGVRYIVEPVAGVNRARNRGARSCVTEIVAYLDDDAVCEPCWLSRLAMEFRDPRVMAVVGRILPLKVTSEAERLFELGGGFDCGPQRRVVDRQVPHWFEIANFGGIGNEANMAFRRSSFDDWPGFNERIGYGTPLAGCSGHYALFSLIERGHRVVYTPDAVVHHPLPKSLKDLHKLQRKILANGAAFITLLFFEHPDYRGNILRSIRGWFRGTPRPWRRTIAPGKPRILPRWRQLLLYLPRPVRYFWAVLAHKRLARKLALEVSPLCENRLGKAE